MTEIDRNSKVPRLRFLDENGENYPEWEMKKLGDVVESIPTTKHKMFSSQVKNIGSIKVIDQGKRLIAGFTDEKDKAINKKSIIYGDHTAIVKLVNPPFVLGGDGTKVLISGNCEIEYVYQSIIYFNVIQSGYKRHFSLLRKILIPVPSLPEQVKIAGFLSALDENIEANESLLELLKVEKTGYLQKIFKKELQFKDENGENYPDWEMKKLGEVAEFKHGYAFSPNSFTDDGEYKIVTISNVSNSKYVIDSKNSRVSEKPKNLQEHQDLKNGDLLVSLTGNCGRISIVNSPNMLLNQRVGIIEPNSLSSEFLYQALKALNFEFKMMSLAYGTAQKNLSNSSVLKFVIPVPSLPEQEKIADFLSALDDRIDAQTELIKTLKEEKKAYLQRIFG